MRMVGSERANRVEPFRAMDVLAEANRMIAAGEDVVSLAVGQPSAPAPGAVRQAAARAVEAGRLGYTDALGRSELRGAIARHYGEHYGLDVSPSRVVVTTGSSAGFALAFLSLFEPGDRVLIERPGYPAYRNIMRVLGLEVIEVERVDADTIEGTERLAGVLVASPANPTGTVIAPERMERIAAACRSAGIALISDEIYHRLTYGGAPDATALSVAPNAIVINSFSKYYCMTGWRVGWMVVPEALVRTVERVAQSLYISAPDASQIGAAHAFEPTDELERVRDGYAANRAALLGVLPALGFELAARSDGAFYAWCDVGRLTNDSTAFSRRMLAEAKVAAPPGHDFDPVNGDRTMRFSYAGSADDMARAVDRLRRWLG